MTINKIDLTTLDPKKRLQVLTLLAYAWAIATDNNVDESDSFLAENVCHNFGVAMNCEDASHVANFGPFDFVDIIKDIIDVCEACGVVRHNLEEVCSFCGATTTLSMSIGKAIELAGSDERQIELQPTTQLDQWRKFHRPLSGADN